MVRKEMVERYGEEAITDCYEVYTTIDSSMQKTANEALLNGLERYDRSHGYRGPADHMLPAGDGSVRHWLDTLARTPVIASQEPAFVQDVQERSFTALLKTGESISVEWDGIRWAKRYINEDAWGSSPRSAQEVVKTGDLVR